MIKGIVIDSNRENAENLKILLEYKDAKLGVKVDILSERDKKYELLDIRKYDFLMTNVKAINERDLKKHIIPFLKWLNKKTKNYIAIYSKKEVIYIDKNDIIGIEVIRKDCYVYTSKDAYKVERISMGSFLEQLNDPYIVRCHKSYALNLRCVEGFKRDTYTRWKPVFLIDTDFDCRVTDIYMGDVVKSFEENNEIDLTNIINKED